MNKFSVFVSYIILLGAIYITYFVVVQPTVIVVDKKLDHFPGTFDGYTSENINMTANVVRELDTDVYLYRNYLVEGQQVNFYVGYYGTQKGGRTGHNPNACYPSSGFAILSEELVELPVVFSHTDPERVKVTRLLISKADEKQIVYHWYQSSANKILPRGIEQNIHRFKTRLFHNRNDGAFIRVSSVVTGNVKETDELLTDFVEKIIPLLEQYWPIESEK